MQDIQVQGFTQRQHVLADIIWRTQDRDQAQRFIDALPPAERRDANIVVTMLTAAVMDSVDSVDSQVTDLLDKFRL